MVDLFILFITLTVFGVGVTIIDFLGIMDNSGEHDDDGGEKGSNLTHNNKQTGEKPGIRILSKLMNALRSAVYFSLGFGPAGLFASFSGLSRTAELIWAFAIGAAMMVLARFIKRLIRRDLDSSIKPDELLQEKGVLLLPLDRGEISKAVVRQYGRETEIFVRCRNSESSIPKGKEIIIEEYDNDIYWVKSAE